MVANSNMYCTSSTISHHVISEHARNLLLHEGLGFRDIEITEFDDPVLQENVDAITICDSDLLLQKHAKVSMVQKTEVFGKFSFVTKSCCAFLKKSVIWMNIMKVYISNSKSILKPLCPLQIIQYINVFSIVFNKFVVLFSR